MNEMTRQPEPEFEIPDPGLNIQDRKTHKDIPNRATVVENVYFQEMGDPIQHFEQRYDANVKSKGIQAYEQRLRATTEWRPLNINWQDLDGNPVSGCSILILRNEEGKFPHTLPTEAEKLEAEKKVIEIGLTGTDDYIQPFASVRPRSALRFSPYDLALLRVRSVYDRAVFTLILLPA